MSNLGMSKEDSEKEVKKYEAYNDTSYELRQQALIAHFVEEFDENVKLWKSGGATLNLIRGQLGLLKNNNRTKPELEYPDSHFKIVQKPPRVHSRKKRGAVDMDEVPGKGSCVIESAQC